MKLVAISQRVDDVAARQETRDGVDQRLVTFVMRTGHLPLPVPNGLHDSLHAWLAVLSPSAVVLSGGNNIGQSADRDSTESVLLTYAKERNLPVLGICRGMQMMAHYAGVSLKPVRGHVRTRHQLNGEISAEVNSFHEYALDRCPADYKVLARSEDGEIEAMRHQTLAWEGWMWHPERELPFAPSDIQRLKGLLE